MKTFSKFILDNALAIFHLRYCFSKTRDSSVEEIQELLTAAGVIYEVNRPQDSDGLCPIVTKATDDAPEGPCALQSAEGHAGLCANHYKEYLATLIRREKVDPVMKFTKHQCLVELANHDIQFNQSQVVEQLKDVIRQSVPLEYA